MRRGPIQKLEPRRRGHVVCGDLPLAISIASRDRVKSMFAGACCCFPFAFSHSPAAKIHSGTFSDAIFESPDPPAVYQLIY
jgi:hypothetical protein